MRRIFAVILVVQELLNAGIGFPTTDVDIVIAVVTIDVRGGLGRLGGNGCQAVAVEYGDVATRQELDAVAVLGPCLLSLTIGRVAVQWTIVDD